MFFIAASVELCSVCDWTVLGAQQWLVLMTSPAQHQGCPQFSVCPLHHHPTALSKQAGGERSWEGTQPGKLSPADLGYLIMSCSALKKKGGWSSKAVQSLAGHCSAQGGWWVIAFASLGFFSFLLSLNCLHLSSWPVDFLTFALPLLSLFHRELGESWAADWVSPLQTCREVATLRETGRLNQHGVRLDCGLTMYICLLIVLAP